LNVFYLISIESYLYLAAKSQKPSARARRSLQFQAGGPLGVKAAARRTLQGVHDRGERVCVCDECGCPFCGRHPLLGSQQYAAEEGFFAGLLFATESIRNLYYLVIFNIWPSLISGHHYFVVISIFWSFVLGIC
jgi:hypothetical protein